MIEHPDTILEGIKTCLDLSGIPKSLICIEDNKPKAIELLRDMASDDPRIDVFELPARYPQGASRVILRNVTGRSVPRGGHLTDVGALLFNVTTPLDGNITGGHGIWYGCGLGRQHIKVQ